MSTSCPETGKVHLSSQVVGQKEDLNCRTRSRRLPGTLSRPGNCHQWRVFEQQCANILAWGGAHWHENCVEKDHTTVHSCFNCCHHNFASHMRSIHFWIHNVLCLLLMFSLLMCSPKVISLQAHVSFFPGYSLMLCQGVRQILWATSVRSVFDLCVRGMSGGWTGGFHRPDADLSIAHLF